MIDRITFVLAVIVEALVLNPWLFPPALITAFIFPSFLVYAAVRNWKSFRILGFQKEKQSFVKYLLISLITKATAFSLITVLTVRYFRSDPVMGGIARWLFNHPWTMLLLPMYLITDPIFFIVRNKDRKSRVIHYLHHPLAFILLGNTIWGIDGLMYVYIYLLKYFLPDTETGL